ncbi:MAG: methyltransferase dimerization domain-containing protein [Nitrospiria bacterium]
MATAKKKTARARTPARRPGTRTVSRPLDPMTVARISSAYWHSKVLHVANRLDVFNRLAEGPATAEELARATGADPRGLDILLIAVTSLGFLERIKGRYRNSRLAETFLVKTSPRYQGGIVSMFEDWYPTWGKLYDAVVSGKPPVDKPHDQGDEATRIYIYGMHYRGVAQAELLAKKIPLKGRKRLVDIAGGPGTFSIMLCKQNKGLSATVIDRPQTLNVTREIIGSYGMQGRVETKPGDYLNDTFGRDHDVALLSSMFNQESPTVIKDILRKTHDALSPGGVVIVQEQLLDDDKSGPPLAAMIGVNQLLHTPGGAAYSGREMGEWMTEVGFRRVKRVPMPAPSPFIVLTGVKSA